MAEQEAVAFPVPGERQGTREHAAEADTDGDDPEVEEQQPVQRTELPRRMRVSVAPSPQSGTHNTQAHQVRRHSYPRGRVGW